MSNSQTFTPDLSSILSVPLDPSELTGDGSDKVDPIQLKAKIRDTIQQILDARFSTREMEKRRISEREDRFAFACPYCGDSATNHNKKRGTLYTNDWNFKCWNQGEFRDMLGLLSDYGHLGSYSSGERAYLRRLAAENKQSTGSGGSSNQSYRSGSADFAKSSADMLGIPTLAIPRQELLSATGLVEVYNSPAIYEYLKGRLQVSPGSDTSHFAYDRDKDLLYLLNLTADNSKVIGMQARIMSKRKGGQRFMSYNYTDMWTVLLDVHDAKAEICRVVDKFSLIYNVLRVDFRYPVTVFEGGIDANHFPNSVATWSAAVKLRLETARYFYDNSRIDPTGLKEAMRMLSDGYQVFLWGKFLTDYPIYKYCKDLNDVMKERVLNYQDLLPYFSSHSLDSFYL